MFAWKPRSWEAGTGGQRVQFHSEVCRALEAHLYFMRICQARARGHRDRERQKLVSVLLTILLIFPFKLIIGLGIVAYIFNYSTQEAEVGGSR